MDRPWVVHYDPGVRPTLEYPDITLPGLFDSTAGRFPHRVATIFHDARVQYAQLQRQINTFSGGLRAAGVRPGDRVALMLPNLPQFIVAFFGTLRAGAIVVPTNPLYTTHELEHQLADSGATAIITLDQLFGPVQAALPNTSVRIVIVAGIGRALPHHLQPFYALQQWREGIRAVRRGGIVHRFEDLYQAAHVDQPEPGSPDDLAVLQYTGGTTGRSKGAMLTHRNLIANALQAREWQGHAWADGYAEDGVSVLCATPFFHVYGLTIGMNLAIAAGATMLLVPRFIPAEVAHIAQEYQPSYFPGIPTMYRALSDLPNISKKHFGSLQVCISGAAPMPTEVQRYFQEVSGARVVEGYGLTEASPVTHCNPVKGGGRAGTVGVPFPDTDARVVDSITGQELPPGTVGELEARGPQIMRGYWNRPEETAGVLHDGWLRTGDMAVMEPDGFFRIVDRKKDVIIASGYNIYPREVEEVLLTHPKVQDAAVIGIPSDYRGETVKACIVPVPESGLTEDEIIAFCREELARYKVPTIVEFREEMPRTLIGKVLRRALREETERSAAIEDERTA